MESKISKLKGIHSFSPLNNLQREWVRGCGAKILGSFGRTVCGTLGTRGFSRVRREFSVVGQSHERQPRLKSLWHPGYVYGDLQLVLQHCCETGLKAMLSFSPPTFKPVFTKQSKTKQVLASCVTTDF